MSETIAITTYNVGDDYAAVASQPDGSQCGPFRGPHVDSTVGQLIREMWLAGAFDKPVKLNIEMQHDGEPRVWHAYEIVSGGSFDIGAYLDATEMRRHFDHDLAFAQAESHEVDHFIGTVEARSREEALDKIRAGEWRENTKVKT